MPVNWFFFRFLRTINRILSSYFSAWLRDEDNEIVRRVSARTGAMTNLTLDTVEELQVHKQPPPPNSPPTATS